MKKWYYSTINKIFIFAYCFPAHEIRFDVLLKNKFYVKTTIK